MWMVSENTSVEEIGDTTVDDWLMTHGTDDEHDEPLP